MPKENKLLAEWFWVDRWTGSSAWELDMEPRGLYREMLSQAWRRKAQLPANFDTIRKITGCKPDEWARCWPQVSRYWREQDGVLVNDTQLEVYREAVAKAAKAVERARKGGRAAARNRRAQARAQAHAQERSQVGA